MDILCVCGLEKFSPELGVHSRLHIYLQPAYIVIFYFPWHRYQIEGINRLGRVHTTCFRAVRDQSRTVRVLLPLSTWEKPERSFCFLKTISRYGMSGPEPFMIGRVRSNCWTDHDQIWHVYADRSGNGSYLKKLVPRMVRKGGLIGTILRSGYLAGGQRAIGAVAASC